MPDTVEESEAGIDTSVLDRTVGKKPNDRPSEPLTEKISTAKIRAEILRKANMVVLHRQRTDRKFSLFHYFDHLLTAAVERDYARMIEEERKE